jgi:hypothetical protein
VKETQPIGIFALLDEQYVPERNNYAEVIVFKLDGWCDEAGIDYHSKSGHVHLCNFDVPLPRVTREEIVSGMVKGLRAKKLEIQAEAQAQTTAIDAKINSLLMLDYSPAVQEPGFAPRRGNGDVTDVEPRVAKPSLDDDIPF